MNKLVVLFALFAAVIARDAYVCEVLLPNFDDSVAQPLMTLSGRTFDLTDNFNLVSFGGMYAPSGDVEGRTAVRNNANFPNGQYSIGYELRTAPITGWDNSLPSSFIVGHDLVWNGGSVHPDGSAFPYPGAAETFFVGGSFTGSSYLNAYRSSASCSTAGCLDSTFDNAQAYYTALSAAWAAVPASASASIQYGGITVTCPNQVGTSWVIDIDGSALSAATYWNAVQCNAESQLVFNVRGSGEVLFQGGNINFRQEKVLYNIIGSGRSVRVITEVRGSILAPNAPYTQPGQGVVKGLVFVSNVVQVHQINRLHCERPVTVPSDHLCPGFETDCAGLNAQVGGSSFSFREFNAISFNDFTAASGDVEGRLAVRNNVYIGSGYSIGYELRTINNIPDRHLSYSLIAGGNVNWTSGEIFPVGNGVPTASAREDMYVGGEFNGADNLAARRTGGPCASSGCLNSVFDAAYSCYSGYSTYAAGKSDNVNKVFQYTGLFLTCSDNTATEYVVSLTPAELNSFTYVVTDNCNFQAYWIVNVRGTGDVTLTGDSWPTIPGATVYNVIGQRTVNVYSTSLTGHLLAPDATLNQAGGVIIGKVVAANIVASLQINKQNTCPVTTTVQLRIVAAEAAQQGAYSVTVFGASGFRVGDVTTLGTITAISGNTVSFSQPLGRPVSAGAFVGYASVGSDSGRAYVANAEQDSSASVAGVAIAALIVSALVL